MEKPFCLHPAHGDTLYSSLLCEEWWLCFLLLEVLLERILACTSPEVQTEARPQHAFPTNAHELGAVEHLKGAGKVNLSAGVESMTQGFHCTIVDRHASPPPAPLSPRIKDSNRGTYLPDR